MGVLGAGSLSLGMCILSNRRRPHSSDKIGIIEQNKRRCRIVVAVSIRGTRTRVRIIPDDGHQASLKPF